MPKGNLRARGAREVRLYESSLAAEREEKFRGTAKVDLNDLTFAHPPIRKYSAKNEEWLLSAFQTDGCSPLLVDHHIPAVIDHASLQDAISISNTSSNTLLSKHSHYWPKLTFKQGFKLLCLQGRHRVGAARKHLEEGYRWWIVDLYSDDLSTSLRASLEDQSYREWPESGGEICYHILKQELAAPPRWSHPGWSRLQSSNEKLELKRLIGRSSLITAFAPLIQIPALWPGVRLGVVGCLLRLKCDEEIVRYLQFIFQFWTTLLNHDKISLEKLDCHTVEALQLRNPAQSLSDRHYLQPLLRSGSIFGSFSTQEREKIWHRLLQFRGLIPTFHTFFEDFKYLEAVAECVKKLVRPAPRQTVRQALEEAFCEEEVATSDPGSEHSAFDNSAGDRDARFELSVRKLYLGAMRELESLRPGSILVGRLPKIQSERNIHVWHSFAVLASKLGFRSTEITEQMLENPDRTAARQSLLRARNPAQFQYDKSELDSYIDEVVAIYARARKLESPAKASPLISAGPGPELKQRCGLPDRKSYEQCIQTLYFDSVHQDDPDQVGELTPLYVRRHVYLTFFGRFNCVLAGAPVHQRGPEISPSVYSQNETLEATPVNEQSHVPQCNPYEESAVIKFMRFEGGGFHLEEEVVTVAGDNTIIEQMAWRYIAQGLMPFSRGFRSLAAYQCRQAALEDQTGIVVLVPRTAMRNGDFFNLMTQERKTLKRNASGDLLEDERPRKHVVRYLRSDLMTQDRNPLKRNASDDLLEDERPRKHVVRYLRSDLMIQERNPLKRNATGDLLEDERPRKQGRWVAVFPNVWMSSLDDL